MAMPDWFKAKYGDDNVCSGWYVKIENGDCELLPYDVHVNMNRSEGPRNGESLTTINNGEHEAKNKIEFVKEQITKQTSNLVSDLIRKEPKN